MGGACQLRTPARGRLPHIGDHSSVANSFRKFASSDLLGRNRVRNDAKGWLRRSTRAAGCVRVLRGACLCRNHNWRPVWIIRGASKGQDCALRILPRFARCASHDYRRPGAHEGQSKDTGGDDRVPAQSKRCGITPAPEARSSGARRSQSQTSDRRIGARSLRHAADHSETRQRT